MQIAIKPVVILTFLTVFTIDALAKACLAKADCGPGRKFPISILLIVEACGFFYCDDCSAAELAVNSNDCNPK